MPSADVELSDRIKEIGINLPEYREDLNYAVDYLGEDPRGSLGKCRLCTERLIIDLYRKLLDRAPAQKGDPLDDPQIQRYLGRKNRTLFRWVREICNSASHVDADEQTEFNERDARRALESICDLLEWHIAHRRLQSGAWARSRRRDEPSQPELRATNGPVADLAAQGRSEREQHRKRSYGWWALGGSLLIGGALLWSGLHSSGANWVRSIIDSGISAGTPPSSPSVSRTDAALVASATAPESPTEPVLPPAVEGADPQTPHGLAALDKHRTAGRADGSMDPPTAGPDDLVWTKQQSQTSSFLYAVGSDHDGRVYAAGEHGLLLVTSDGGRRWQRLQTNTKAHLFAIAAVPGVGVIAVGDHGTLIEPTRNGSGGRSFSARTLRQAFGAPLWAAYANSPDDWLVGGQHGTLLQVHREPHAEKRLLADVFSPVTIHSLAGGKNNVLYAAGDHGTLLRGERDPATQSIHWRQVASPFFKKSDTFWQVGEPFGQLLLVGESESFTSDNNVKIPKRGIVLSSTDGVTFHRETFLNRPVNPLYSFVPSSGSIIASTFVQKIAYVIQSQGTGASDIQWDRQQVPIEPGVLPSGKYPSQTFQRSPGLRLFFVCGRGTGAARTWWLVHQPPPADA